MGTRNSPAPAYVFLSFPLLLCFLFIPSQCATTDTLTQSQPISVGQTLISQGQIFELGFFIPTNSSKQYIGVWYKTAPGQKVLWVLNRENPLSATDNASSLTIGSNGNLRLLDGKMNNLWSTNVSVQSNNTIAVLSDKGELVLKDNASGSILWESFNYPGNTFLSGMMIGMNYKTGEKRSLTSWQTNNDPSPGNFVEEITLDTPPQAIVWNGLKPHWRSGPWDGSKFIGIPSVANGYMVGLSILQDNQQGTVFLAFNSVNASFVTIIVLTPEGSMTSINWEEGKDWYTTWIAPAPGNPCDVYGFCGTFGVCNNNNNPICQCLKGFVPNSAEEWSKGNWTGGCVRRTELPCQKNISTLANATAKNDGFWQISQVKLPDNYQSLLTVVNDNSGCQQWCLNNCSCVAYAFPAGIGCLVWTGGLVDIQQYSIEVNDLFLRLADSELGNNNDNKKRNRIIISVTIISGVILLAAFLFGLRWWRAKQRVKTIHRIKSFESAERMVNPRDTPQEIVWAGHVTHPESSELPMLDLTKILVATNNFSQPNKLGEGGFGPVYKGKLEDGQQIAVKRLSSHSGQGNEEFKNEIILISKLRHRNLVRLLGCCIEGEEKILVYEYLTNRSLDTILFDAKKKEWLDWAKRFNIIQGIARGLLYLHRDSCLRVIHRDLKASNILLDDDMNPKISDFGLARTFQVTQELVNTRRVMGTFGYMSPEYAMGGLFSEKSDVFAFGVLLLEIVSGMRNTSLYHYQEQHLNLLGYAWQMWNERRGLDFVDETLVESCSRLEVTRCIHIGLLCVQDHAGNRPTMSAVVLMLSSELEVPQPKQPAFTMQSLLDSDLQSQYNNIYSEDSELVSIIEGR
ncbi:G-type lectin S-receptor-like serine/threonine-protein kinase SD1-29 [Camellia sinensis]|uniref:Receptor-like serine/threonine-protein kinase n=1 Tax=Camellia sinensis var. sinensis TaxID=542762 RepID=A0A4V3WPQ0_CAMSN|nr:G-type lectin S-receptor-like serine/threonine-protein kinase SD1-29 [Camellia sinensis]THG17327.1 hypothetical protein TEA_018306 [Camellia sinensis var. sinensis]